MPLFTSSWLKEKYSPAYLQKQRTIMLGQPALTVKSHQAKQGIHQITSQVILAGEYAVANRSGRAPNPVSWGKYSHNPKMSVSRTEPLHCCYRAQNHKQTGEDAKDGKGSFLVSVGSGRHVGFIWHMHTPHIYLHIYSVINTSSLNCT